MEKIEIIERIETEKIKEITGKELKELEIKKRWMRKVERKIKIWNNKKDFGENQIQLKKK